MSEKTFGTWLLEQQGRQDTTGTLARAWQQLRDSRGYKRHTKAESIRELMSGALGEDWQALRGDESIAAAVKEWQGAESEQLAIPVGSDQTEEYYLQGPGGSIQYDTARTVQGELVPNPSLDVVVLPAVLAIGEVEYLLEPGRRYTLGFGSVAVRDEQGMLLPEHRPQPAEKGQDGAPVVLEDGHLNWAVLYAKADHGAREGEWPE